MFNVLHDQQEDNSVPPVFFTLVFSVRVEVYFLTLLSGVISRDCPFLRISVILRIIMLSFIHISKRVCGGVYVVIPAPVNSLL